MRFRLLFMGPLSGLIFLLSGCTAVTAVSTATKIANVALESMGLKTPDVPELPEFQKPPRNVALKLHAGNNLNAGATDKSLSLVTRIYKLKQTSAFYAAPYDAFLSPEKEKATLGQDLLDVREVNLVPGQLYEVNEKVSREATFVGVVTLFRSPAPERWRVTFNAVEAEKSGIRIGLHACSLTIGQGAAREQGNISVFSNTPARCQ
jgi:type VI secretion system protein VasD